MYYYECELVFKSYMPKKIEKGMLFIKNTLENIIIWELQSNPMLEPYYNKDRFLQENGAPLEVYLVDIFDDNHIIAEPHEIGWLYNDETLKEVSFVTLTELNFIISQYGGRVEIEIIEKFFDEDEQIVPNYHKEKIILKLINEEE